MREFPGAGLSGRAFVDPLARGVEVRRARLPLLPARRRPRDRRAADRRGDAGLGRWLLHGVADETIEDVAGAGPSRGLRRRRARKRRAVMAVWPTESSRSNTFNSSMVEAVQELKGSAGTGKRTGSAATIRCLIKRSTKSPRHRERRDFRRTDHPPAAQPAGLRRPDVDPGERFYRMLSRGATCRRRGDAIAWSPAIHLGLFVHRVEGIEPGLYVLARDPASWRS